MATDEYPRTAEEFLALPVRSPFREEVWTDLAGVTHHRPKATKGFVFAHEPDMVFAVSGYVLAKDEDGFYRYWRPLW